PCGRSGWASSGDRSWRASCRWGRQSRTRGQARRPPGRNAASRGMPCGGWQGKRRAATLRRFLAWMSPVSQMNAPVPRLGPLPFLIFSSRWLQLPLYLGLIAAQCVYVFLFGKELWHLIHDTPSLGEQDIMLIVLGLIDVVMISNLLVMVIVGGYETFVSRLGLQGHPDQPE